MSTRWLISTTVFVWVGIGGLIAAWTILMTPWVLITVPVWLGIGLHWITLMRRLLATEARYRYLMGYDDMISPLNGTKTHPLTPHGWMVLESLADSDRPAQELNPGVVNRLRREQLIELVEKVSIFKAHKGGKISYARITAAGLDALKRPRVVLAVCERD